MDVRRNKTENNYSEAFFFAEIQSAFPSINFRQDLQNYLSLINFIFLLLSNYYT